MFIDRYVLESEHMKKFFDYIQLPNFDIASDASATFKVSFLNFVTLTIFSIYYSLVWSYCATVTRNYWQGIKQPWLNFSPIIMIGSVFIPWAHYWKIISFTDVFVSFLGAVYVQSIYDLLSQGLVHHSINTWFSYSLVRANLIGLVRSIDCWIPEFSVFAPLKP